MKVGTCNMGIILHEKVSFSNAPLHVLVRLFRIFWSIMAQHIFPHKDCSVLADGIDCLLVFRKPGAHNCLPMPG